MASEGNSLHVTVETIMTSEVHVVTPMMTIREAIRLLVSNKVSGAPVVDVSNTVVSVLSEGDTLKLAATQNLDTKISSCLDKLVKSDKVITVKRTDSFVDVYRLFLKNPVHRILVTDDQGKLKGIVSRSNVLRTFIQQS